MVTIGADGGAVQLVLTRARHNSNVNISINY